MSDICARLAEPFDPAIVSWRVGPTNQDKSKGMALASVPCLICGGPFRRPRPSAVAKGYGKYCSRACSNKARTKTAAERFWLHVDRRDPDECWPWLGAIQNKGIIYLTPSRDFARLCR